MSSAKGPNTMKATLTRAGIFLLWLVISYAIFGALSPVIVAIVGPGFPAYVVFAFLGLGMGTVLPKITDRLRGNLPAAGPALEDRRDPARTALALAQSPLRVESIGELGGYQLLGLLGQTERCSMFLARRPGSLTTVALKLPASGWRHDQLVWRLLKREASALERLRGIRGVPEILDRAKLDDGCPMLLLRPDRCTPLSRLLDDFDLGQALSAIYSLARTADRCHRKGVVHRMIHLDNVLIDDFGKIQLSGFEWAFRQGESAPISTEDASLEAQAPELFERGSSVMPQVDIYSIGCVAHHLFTGRPAHPWKSQRLERIAAIRAGVVDWDLRESLPLDIERRFDADPTAAGQIADVILRCLAKDPGDRFSSGRKLADSLRELRNGAQLIETFGVFHSGAAWDALESTTAASSSGSRRGLADSRSAGALASSRPGQDARSSRSPARSSATTRGAATHSRARPAARPEPQRRPAPKPASDALPPQQDAPLATLFGESLEEDS